MRRLAPWTIALVGVAVVAIAAVAIVSPRRSVAEEQGVSWHEGSVEDALRRGRAEGKKVFLAFEADWCPSCRQLEAEVLSKQQGRELTGGMISVQVDFDAESSRRYVERFVVLGLPTVVVVGPEGSQLGRVMGYESREEWLIDAQQARESDDPLPALRKLHRSNSESAAAALELGKALLVRGSTEEGESLLEQVTWAHSGEDSARSAEALFVLGRYYHRVKQNPDIARHLWRELASRYPSSEWAQGAPWWYAKAQAELGRHEVGLAALRARANASPNDVDAIVEWGEYVAMHKLTDHQRPAKLALDAAKGRTTDEEELREIAEVLDKLQSR